MTVQELITELSKLKPTAEITVMVDDDTGWPFQSVFKVEMIDEKRRKSLGEEPPFAAGDDFDIEEVDFLDVGKALITVC